MAATDKQDLKLLSAQLRVKADRKLHRKTPARFTDYIRERAAGSKAKVEQQPSEVVRTGTVDAQSETFNEALSAWLAKLQLVTELGQVPKRAVETKTNVHVYGDGGQFEGDLGSVLGFDPSDRHAASLTFQTEPPVTWLFALQLLEEGRSGSVGLGDVAVWPKDRRQLYIKLRSPDGSVRFATDRRDVDEFLGQVRERLDEPSVASPGRGSVVSGEGSSP